MDARGEVTTLLAAYGEGKAEALGELIPLVYDELRRLARTRRYRWGDEQAPGTTSLVHEAYLNLVDQTRCQWRESLTIRRAKLSPLHPDLAQSLSNLGLLLQQTGRLDESEELGREALAIRRRTLGQQHVLIVQSLNNLGQLLQARRQYSQAEALLRESLAMGTKLRGPEHPAVAISLNNLGFTARRNGKTGRGNAPAKPWPSGGRCFRRGICIPPTRL